MAQLTLFPALQRLYRVEFHHAWFGWIAFDIEKTSFRAAMEHRNEKGSGCYRYRIVSRFRDGTGTRIEYQESRPRRK